MLGKLLNNLVIFIERIHKHLGVIVELLLEVGGIIVLIILCLNELCLVHLPKSVQFVQQKNILFCQLLEVTILHTSIDFYFNILFYFLFIQSFLIKIYSFFLFYLLFLFILILCIIFIVVLLIVILFLALLLILLLIKIRKWRKLLFLFLFLSVV